WKSTQVSSVQGLSSLHAVAAVRGVHSHVPLSTNSHCPAALQASSVQGLMSLHSSSSLQLGSRIGPPEPPVDVDPPVTGDAPPKFEPPENGMTTTTPPVPEPMESSPSPSPSPVPPPLPTSSP